MSVHAESVTAELRREVHVDPFLMVFGHKAKQLGPGVVSTADRRRLNDIFSTMSNKNLKQMKDFFRPLSTARTLHISWKTENKAADLQLLEKVMDALDVNVNETKKKLKILPRSLGFSIHELHSARRYLSEQVPIHSKSAETMWEKERKNLELLMRQLGMHRLKDVSSIKKKDLESVPNNSPLANVLILTEMAKRYRVWGLRKMEKATLSLAKTEMKRAKKEIEKSSLLSKLNKKMEKVLNAANQNRGISPKQVELMQLYGRTLSGIVRKLKLPKGESKQLLDVSRTMMAVRKGDGGTSIHLTQKEKAHLNAAINATSARILSLSYSDFVAKAFKRLQFINKNKTDRQKKSQVLKEITTLLENYEPGAAVTSADQAMQATGVTDVNAIFTRYKKTKVFEQFSPLEEKKRSRPRPTV